MPGGGLEPPTRGFSMMNLTAPDTEIATLIDSLSAEDCTFVASALLILSQEGALSSDQLKAVRRTQYLLQAFANYKYIEAARPKSVAPGAHEDFQ